MSAADLEALRARLGDRYRIERELGRGGMGAVYLAHDLRLDRPVALKVLPPSVAGDAGLRERFLRETRTAASFSHPNIVPVFAVEEGSGLLAFAMGYIEGESLADRVRRAGPLAPREATRLLLDVAYALAYAHGRGVVHRDIKPDNIMIERATGRALVMDFGISRRIEATPAATEGLTRVGEVVGTPEYMSPEQASGDQVDGRSDLYSLGLVGWFALTGDTAMAADTTQKVLVKQLTAALPPLESVVPDLPAPLASAVDRCLAKEPDGRPADAGALVELLEKAQQAAPEIPLTVRLLASELSALTQVLFFAALFLGYLALRAIASNLASLDALLPMVIIVSVMITRVGQGLAEVARVMAGGYDAEGMRAALAAVLEEAVVVRRTRARDAATLARRRRTVRTAIQYLVLAPMLLAGGWFTRVPVPTGGWRTGIFGATLLFTGLALFGVGMVLLIRNPLATPLFERLLRVTWLGWPGRLGMARVERRLAREAAVNRDTPVRPVSAAVAAAPTAALPRTPAPASAGEAAGRAAPAAAGAREAAAPATRLDAIEQRLDALEAWRRSQGGA